MKKVIDIDVPSFRFFNLYYIGFLEFMLFLIELAIGRALHAFDSRHANSLAGLSLQYNWRSYAVIAAALWATTCYRYMKDFAKSALICGGDNAP